jgi:hypothetical protein
LIGGRKNLLPVASFRLPVEKEEEEIRTECPSYPPHGLRVREVKKERDKVLAPQSPLIKGDDGNMTTFFRERVLLALSDNNHGLFQVEIFHAFE